MRRRLLSLACAAIVLALAGPPGVAGAAEPAPKDNGVRRWAVRPAGKDGKPDSRTHFTLESTPGSTVDDAALVTNLSRVPVTFRVYGTDAFNTPTGNFDLLAADRKPADVGAWMTAGTGSVTVGAGKSAVVKFKVVIPATATPGDHAGGLIVSTLAAAGKQAPKVNIESRVAVRVYLRVPGDLRPLLAVSAVDTAYHGVRNPFGRGRVAVTYTVTNQGNIRLRSDPTVTVRNALGRKVANLTPGRLPEILPHQSVTFTAEIDRVFPAGPLTTKVSLVGLADPEQPVGQRIPAVSRSGYFWAVSWWLAGIAGAVLLLLAALWRWRRRQLMGRLRRTWIRARRRPVGVTAGVGAA